MEKEEEEKVYGWYSRVESKWGETTWFCSDFDRNKAELLRQWDRHSALYHNKETGEIEDPEVHASASWCEIRLGQVQK